KRCSSQGSQRPGREHRGLPGALRDRCGPKSMQPMNRRSFLHVTLGAAATAAFLPHARAAAPRRNLRKAIMYSTIGMKGTVLEKFRAMKEAGFEGVEPMGGMD